MSEKTEMCLWVLEGDGVLTDYTNGMVCVLAYDETQAWELLKAKDRIAWLDLRGWPNEPDERALEQLPMRFRRVDKPEAFTVHGGG